MVMNKIMPNDYIKAESDEPPSPEGESVYSISDITPVNNTGGAHKEKEARGGLLGSIIALFRGRSDASLRETIEEAIEDDDNNFFEEDDVSAHEKILLSNVLQLKDLVVTDVMVPRADIVAVDIESSHDELLTLLAEKQFSRLPVYHNNLDDMRGTIHIKDIMAALAKGEEIIIQDLVREIPIVSPSMPVLDLMLHMQQTHKHMAFVVDEFGGIDGLVTIGDTIESVVGELEDEYDQNNNAEMEVESPGVIVADARIDIDLFEKEFGAILNEDEREESETLGGLLFYMAGRVPARGEVLKHDTGMLFEVLDADPRKINRLRIKNIPGNAS